MSHGPLMLDLSGTEITAEERELLLHPATGGVILFARNFESPEQVAALVAEIHALRSPALLVAVDQEGGRVQRFQKGFTRLPPAAWFGRLYNHNHKLGREAAREAGWLMATELRTVGVDFSFAPVLDLDHGLSQVIGDRAFHGRPDAAAELALAWMRGVHEAGMAAVGKHFPGHGGVDEDSHHALPVDRRRAEAIMMDDIQPFSRLIEHGLEGIMPAHVIYEQVDAALAGFSSRWLKDILRGRLGFQGAIFSDDLSMAAADVAGGYSERARTALAAGCDMVLVCNDLAGAAQVLDELEDYTNPVGQMRLVRMHGRGKVSRDQMHLDARWQAAVHRMGQYDANPSLALDLVSKA